MIWTNFVDLLFYYWEYQVEFDLLWIYEDFYYQKCNVNVMGLDSQFEQIELSEVWY